MKHCHGEHTGPQQDQSPAARSTVAVSALQFIAVVRGYPERIHHQQFDVKTALLVGASSPQLSILSWPQVSPTIYSDALETTKAVEKGNPESLETWLVIRMIADHFKP